MRYVTNFVPSLERIYSTLCTRYGRPASQKHQKQKSYSPPTKPCQPVIQCVDLAPEESKHKEEEDDTESEALVQSPLITPVPSTSNSKANDIHLADDELGEALEVMAAVQASEPYPNRSVLAD